MRVLAVLISILALTGCSATGLKKAEENTRLAGVTSPLGAIIHLPIWVAATVANAGTGSTVESKDTREDAEFPTKEK